MSEIPDGEKVKESGKKLMTFDVGFVEIIGNKSPETDTVFVVVHGVGSRGYEWVYALHKMEETGKKTLFYRYDWNQCPDIVSENLSSGLKDWIAENQAEPYVIMFSHSYGGTVATALAGLWDLPLSGEIHSIAAPLGHHERFATKCGYENGIIFDSTFTVSGNISHVQWRTVQSSDGAFRDLEIDPQIVSIKGSTVRLLPAEFPNGKRLGHNWSITWVMDEYFR